jgi:hypothetical protein
LVFKTDFVINKTIKKEMESIMLVKKIIASAVLAITLATGAGSAFAGTVNNVVDTSGSQFPSKLCYGKHRMDHKGKMTMQAVANPSPDKSRVDFRVSNRSLGRAGAIVINGETKTSVNPRLGANL